MAEFFSGRAMRAPSSATRACSHLQFGHSGLGSSAMPGRIHKVGGKKREHFKKAMRGYLLGPSWLARQCLFEKRYLRAHHVLHLPA